MSTFTILMTPLSLHSSIVEFLVSRKGWPRILQLVKSTYQSKIYSINTAHLKTTLSKLKLRSLRLNRSLEILVRLGLVVTPFLLRRFADHRKNKLCHLPLLPRTRIIRIRQSKKDISKSNRHNSIGREKETKRWCINWSLPILLQKAEKWWTIRESGHFTQTISTMSKTTQISSSCKEAWTLSTRILQCMTAKKMLMFQLALVAEDRPWEGLLTGYPQLNHPLRTIWSCKSMRPWKKFTCNKRPWICLTPECPTVLSNHHHSDLREPETLHPPKLTITSKRIS